MARVDLEAGFSLVEIILVVVIMAILSVIVIRVYMEFSLRTKKSEPVVNLRAIRIAEEGYRAENDGYINQGPAPMGGGDDAKPDVWTPADSASFGDIGFEPDGATRFIYRVFDATTTVYTAEALNKKYKTIFTVSNDPEKPDKSAVYPKAVEDELSSEETTAEEHGQRELDDIRLPEYFPLKRGNRWKYEVAVDGKFIRDCEAILCEALNIVNKEPKLKVTGRAEDVTSGFFFRDTAESGYHNDSNNYAASDGRILYHRSHVIGEEQGILVFLDSDMIVGKETVTVPAGTFDCIKIKRDNSCNTELLSLQTHYAPMDSLSVYEWYSKDVGMVKREYRISAPKGMGKIERKYILFKIPKKEVEFSQSLTEYELK